MDEKREGEPSAYSCPDCNGVLWELREGELLRYQCRTGHAYSPDNMRAAYDDSVEAALWAAVRSLEESADFERELAQMTTNQAAAKGLQDHARTRLQHASRIREIIMK